MTTASTEGSSPLPRLPDSAYRRMSLVLRVGLALSLSILGVGIIAYILAYPGATSSSVFATNPIGSYLSIPGLASGLAAGSVGAYLTLGVVVLVATPVARVVSGFYYFRKDGEKAMAAITFTVILLLLVGLLVIGPWVR